MTAERREPNTLSLSLLICECVCVCVGRFRIIQNALTSIENLNDISLYSTSFSVILSELIGSWRVLIKGVALFTNMEVFIRQKDLKCDTNSLFIIAPVSVYANPLCGAWCWQLMCENWGTRLNNQVNVYMHSVRSCMCCVRHTNRSTWTPGALPLCVGRPNRSALPSKPLQPPAGEKENNWRNKRKERFSL